MKNIKTVLIAVSALMISCQDFLTVIPSDSVTADNYYKTSENLRANTASLYGRVWWDFQSNFMWMAGDELAGDVYYTYSDEGQFYYNSVTAGNSFNNNGWVGLYNVVSFANSIINDMPPSVEGSGIAQTDIDAALAEARFMRAVAYYFLTEYWGEVPIIENSTALITSGNVTDIYVNRHTQGSLYRFICDDLEFAAANLPPTDPQSGRVTSWSAKGMLAKVLVTRGAYEGNAGYFARAKDLSREVIEDSGLGLHTDFSTLFDYQTNNNPESLFAIQVKTGGYGEGSSRNVVWARGSTIADQSWGAGKGPTLSLQKLYEPKDKRRMWTFMTQGDYYSMLDRAGGGYTYRFLVPETTDAPNEVLAHIKKYVIGKAADCDGQVGMNQDAGNNIYVLRLADVYMLYAEACMGLDDSTSDAAAMDFLHAVRARAGYTDAEKLTSVTYEQLLVERRKEFALEGINWMDIKRYYYRDQQAALDYLAGMNRDAIYRLDWDNAPDVSEEAARVEYQNDKSNYVESWQTLSDSEDFDSRVPFNPFTAGSMYLELPAEVVTKAPVLMEPAVDYYADQPAE